MAEIQKFLFDRRFDRPVEPVLPEVVPEELVEAPAVEPEPEPEPEPPAPTFSAEELEAARQSGYTAGHTDAMDEAEAANGRMAALAMSTAAQALEALSREHRSGIDTLAADVAHLVEVICHRLLPFTCDQNAVAEIVALAQGILPHVLEEPRLVVRVHPDVLESVKAHIDPLATSLGYEGRLLVTADIALARPDCRIEWTDGGVERDTGRLWNEIHAIVAQFSGNPDRLAEPEPEPPPPHSGDPATRSETWHEPDAPLSPSASGSGWTESAAPGTGAGNAPADDTPASATAAGSGEPHFFPPGKGPFPSVGPVTLADPGEVKPAPPVEPVENGRAAFPRQTKKAGDTPTG